MPTRPGIACFLQTITFNRTLVCGERSDYCTQFLQSISFFRKNFHTIENLFVSKEIALGLVGRWARRPPKVAAARHL